MQQADILTFQEPSLSNGDILTYFELGSHWSYNHSFWHLNSSWDNDLSLHSWYLTCPVSCLLELQYLWISQSLKPLAGDFEQLQGRCACCLPVTKVSFIKSSVFWRSVCTLWRMERPKSLRVSGMKNFVHIPLVIWTQLPLWQAPSWHARLSQQPVCSAPAQWKQCIECSWLYALSYNWQVNGCLVKCKIKYNLYQEVKNISLAVERLIQIPTRLLQ